MNVARFVGVSPEDALTHTNRKFVTRFQHIEKRLEEDGRTPEDATLEEMDRFWDEAKSLE